MSLTITEMPMVQLLDGAGQALYVAAEDTAYVGLKGNAHLVKYRGYPNIVFRLNQYREPGLDYQSPTDIFIASLQKFYAQPLSVYRVVNGQLSFSRNLSFDTSLLHWVLRKCGDYIIFDRDGVHCLRVTGTKNNPKFELVDPTANFPVSHLKPTAAWY